MGRNINNNNNLSNNNTSGNSSSSNSGTPSSRITVTHNGFLYDVTEFASRHPGGRELLERHNGRDVGAVMRDAASHEHSRAAYAILEKYRVPRNGGGRHAEELSQERGTSLSNGQSVSDDFDGYVDWSQPLLSQVEELGDRYFEWTHAQVDRPIRLFHSDLAEMLTRSHWWMVPITWCPVILVMVFSAYRHLAAQPETWPKKNVLACQYGPSSIPLLFAVGVLFWTLLEYVIHRWLFHLNPGSSRFLIRLHFSLHGQHHKSPMDPMRLVFPPLPAAFFALLFYLMTGAIFPTGMSHTVFAGIVAGYLAYDLTHYYVHHGGRPRLAYFRRLKKYHTLHHYKHQQSGFGISSKLWDYPFGTLIPEDLRASKSQ